MNLSTKGRYGLRALCELAMQSNDKPVSLTRIAELQDLSLKYLEQIFHLLKKAGYIKSVRGVNGGYLMNKPPSEITVGEILRLLEGDVAPIHCVSDECVEECKHGEECITKPFWEELSQTVYKVMDDKTIQDLIERN